MSDPVTNAEVEDVLSSIRRLVSEDKRPLQTQAKPASSDRLVLTPALRVADHDSDNGAEASVSEAEDWSEDEDDDTDFYDDKPVEEDPEDQSFFDRDGTPDAGEQDDDSVAEPEPDLQKNDTADVIFTSDATEDYDDPAHDYEADPYNFDDDGDEDGEGRYRAFRKGTDLFREDAPSDADASDSDVQIAMDAGTPGHQDTKAANLSAKIEALETAIGNIADRWEPDSPGADEYSGTEQPAMTWEDDLEEDEGQPARLHNLHTSREVNDPDASFFENSDVPVPPAIGKAKLDADAKADSFVFADEDQVLDEEALRDLVSEIVRAELQGALGERITRNVRKLVRREIHRALTAQELE